MGRRDATDTLVEVAARADGYQTVIGESGASFSGGQKPPAVPPSAPDLFGYRRVGPVDDVALLHLSHEKEDVFAHFDVLAKGQVRNEQPSAGALGPLDGKAVRWCAWGL